MSTARSALAAADERDGRLLKRKAKGEMEDQREGRRQKRKSQVENEDPTGGSEVSRNSVPPENGDNLEDTMLQERVNPEAMANGAGHRHRGIAAPSQSEKTVPARTATPKPKTVTPTANTKTPQKTRSNSLSPHDHLVVKAHIVNKLFKKVKFISADQQLEFQGKIAENILKGCRVDPKTSSTIWELIRPHVRPTLNQKRSNINGEFKKAFLRKCKHNVPSVLLNIWC